MFEQHEKLETPVRAVHTFHGGPLDGQKHEATEHYKLIPEKTMVVIDNANYIYKGDGKMVFKGMTHKAEFLEPTLMQKIKTKILKFLLS